MGRKGRVCEASRRSSVATPRLGAITKQTCPLRPTAGGTESIHLRRRDGSKGLLTQLSPSLLASGSILCRREAISFQKEPRSGLQTSQSAESARTILEVQM